MTRQPHYCHAMNCKTPVPPRMLMCLKHWRKVPKDAQQAVWKNYRPGQERDKKPSLHYIVSALAAIFAVADSEGVEYDAQAIIQNVGIKFLASESPERLQQFIEQEAERSDRK